jgi:hypothetical protein
MKTLVFVGFMLLLTASPVPAAGHEDKVQAPHKFAGPALSADMSARIEEVRCSQTACNRVSANQLKRLRNLRKKSPDALFRMTPAAIPEPDKANRD